MSVQYHISPSGHNLRCKICGNYYLFGNIRVCQVCGIIVCKKHFKNGFCDAHYAGLTDKDKQRVQGYLQEIAKINKIFYWLVLGWIISLVSPFLWGFLANPTHEDVPTPFFVALFIMTIPMAFGALLSRVQRDANWGEITRIAKRYEKAQKAALMKASKPPAMLQDRNCPRCGNFNVSTARFCSTCGKDLELTTSPTL